MHAVVDSLTQIYSPSQKYSLGNLSGSSLALAAANLANKHPGFTLAITPNNQQAEQLAKEMAFFAPNLNILSFPDWETLPYDNFSPHHHLISTRLGCLAKLGHIDNGTIIVSITTLLHHLSPTNFIQSHSLCIKKGDSLDIEHFKQTLIQSGYRIVNTVIEHGECAVRGSIIDLFPMGSKQPFRLDLFDNEIDSIRVFCTETQCSLEQLSKIELLPAREFPIDDTAITLFRQQWRDFFTGNPSLCPIYEEISEGIIPAGIEYYLPLFFKETASLFDYLPKDSLLLFIENIHDEAESFLKEANFRYEQRAHDITRPILKPDQLFYPIDVIKNQAKAFKQIYLTHDSSKYHNANFNQAPHLPIKRQAKQPLIDLAQYLKERHQEKTLLVVESAGRREVLLELLKNINHSPAYIKDWQTFVDSKDPFSITEGPLEAGFESQHDKLNIITEFSLYGEKAIKASKSKRFDSQTIVRDLTELKVGSPVVHIEHGVGRYQGLTHLSTNGQKSEFFILSYAGGDKIYVPVTSLELISRYTGGDLDHAPLHKLGTQQWQKEKKKAQEKVSDVAVKLLDVYAQREAKVGFAFDSPNEQYHHFSSLFPFEETDDQKRAIQDIINDMTSIKPMDRLICGDVGFGKTEVAMRAAFLAIQNLKQVCILVPTTLLASQHFENISDRFAEFPINIGLLSRFKTQKEINQTLSGLKNGSIDLVVGTHKLLQKGMEFKNLGLVIIDEEHRFGVKQKEFLKAMRTNVDILSMTATPIPRTLNMAMSGIRDISIIATPPAKRLAIKTFWYERKSAIIKEAVLREVMRGGQVFFLHNAVETIEKVAHELQSLIPQAKVTIAHGQMRERQLEKIMADFYHHRFNVLVCTTIIETGIDIPTANTIVIDKADRFGLAQLHQLRGRVGRSHHQAYAYLLTGNKKALTKDAQKRLDAIVGLEDLGAGFMLATHDLEIRGAGELLGEEQSGNMHAIGFTLYMELLKRTVDAIKEGKTPELAIQLEQQDTEIQLPVSMLIPDDYIYDIHNRLVLYKRIASCENKTELDSLYVEMVDRFGLLPQETKDLLSATHLKQKMKKIGIKKLQINQDGSGKIQFNDKPNIEPQKIIKLLQIHSKLFKLASANALNIFISPEKGFLNEAAHILSFFSG